MQIIEQFIPKSHEGRRPGFPMRPTGLTIHSTGNAKSTAKNEADNVCNNNPTEERSFHYVVGEGTVYQTLPTNESAWHAGDGFAGKGNRRTIAIEIVETGDRRAVLLTAAQLVAKLLKDFKLDISTVYQHNHWARKDCPRILRNPEFIKDGMDWNWFIGQIRILMGLEKSIDWANSLELLPEGKDLEDIVDYKTLFDILYKLSRR